MHIFNMLVTSEQSFSCLKSVVGIAHTSLLPNKNHPLKLQKEMAIFFFYIIIIIIVSIFKKSHGNLQYACSICAKFQIYCSKLRDELSTQTCHQL